jgi:hypothetical protein
MPTSLRGVRARIPLPRQTRHHHRRRQGLARLRQLDARLFQDQFWQHEIKYRRQKLPDGRFHRPRKLFHSTESRSLPPQRRYRPILAPTPTRYRSSSSLLFPNWLEGGLARVLRSRLHDGSPELYIGGSGAKFPFLHFDSYHTHAFLTQIYGTKEYTAFSEDQTPLLYVNPHQYNASQIPNIENPDIENPDFQKFRYSPKPCPCASASIPARFSLSPGACGTPRRCLPLRFLSP